MKYHKVNYKNSSMSYYRVNYENFCMSCGEHKVKYSIVRPDKDSNWDVCTRCFRVEEARAKMED